eukprot:2449202-Karenia_brevis.AAC.1
MRQLGARRTRSRTPPQRAQRARSRTPPCAPHTGRPRTLKNALQEFIRKSRDATQLVAPALARLGIRVHDRYTDDDFVEAYSRFFGLNSALHPNLLIVGLNPSLLVSGTRINLYAAGEGKPKHQDRNGFDLAAGNLAVLFSV